MTRAGHSRVHVWIEGRVQGVGFRFFAQDTARREGVSGSVRNLPDGRVEVDVEGEKKTVTVGIRLSEIKGRTFNEIYEALDQKVNAHLESLRTRGLGLDRSV